MATTKICSIADCGKPVRNSHGFCGAHYMRWRRHGHPLLGNAARGAPRAWLREHINHQDDDCLIWPYARLQNGYAVVRLNDKERPGPYIAARVMCELVYGNPPEDWYEAAHSCGNGSGGCVNPRHLRWATPQDNRRDKIVHATSGRGAANPRAKLTESDVRYVRAMKGKIPLARLAEQYGVSQGLISRLQSGIDWSWLK